MEELGPFGDVTVSLGDDHVAQVEIHRAPNSFLDSDLITGLADAFERLDESPCRAARPREHRNRGVDAAGCRRFLR